jgi:hypothetical protein
MQNHRVFGSWELSLCLTVPQRNLAGKLVLYVVWEMQCGVITQSQAGIAGASLSQTEMVREHEHRVSQIPSL